MSQKYKNNVQILHSFSNNDNSQLALTIGHFDGVHLGHQAIFNELTTVACAENLIPSAMTFSPHAKVFFDNASDFLIINDSRKADLLAKNGIKRLYDVPFDANLSSMSASDFVDMLIHRLNVKHLLVGDDFRFGHMGYGDYALLERVCRANNIRIGHTPTITHQGERVSSSRVREAIKASDFELVKALLGHQISYAGKVITGKQLGRTINFPTANVRLPVTRLLPEGVFAVTVHIIGDKSNIIYHGMSNIGTKPTVDDSNTRQIETHIFDFSGDLYGKEIAITPTKKLRDEQKFDGIDALVAQLHRDKEKAVRISQETPQSPNF